MIGLLATENYSLEFITSLIGLGFFIGAIYFTWIVKTQNIKDVKI
jgi:hypothetical protein